MKLVNIQGRVPEEYFKIVRQLMDERSLNWNQVLTMCMASILKHPEVMDELVKDLKQNADT